MGPPGTPGESWCSSCQNACEDAAALRQEMTFLRSRLPESQSGKCGFLWLITCNEVRYPAERLKELCLEQEPGCQDAPGGRKPNRLRLLTAPRWLESYSCSHSHSDS